MKAVSLSDYRELARRKLPRFLFDYIDGGSYDEVTLRRNVSDLQSVELRQRVLRDVSTLDLSIQLLGRRLALPLVLGPVALAGLNARRGEVQAARAAEAFGVPFCLSTVGACSLDEVKQKTHVAPWFQLYMIRDRVFMRELLAKAQSIGCPALVFTVDLAVPGSRYRDYRSGLAGAPGLKGSLRRGLQAICRPHWTWDVGIRGRPHSLGNVASVLGSKAALADFMGWVQTNFDPQVSWQDLDFIRSIWTGPLILKGILDVEDAREAVRMGADAIVVSNHGGRQLDGVSSTVRALAPIVDAVGTRLPVLVDGGIRSGLDVVRMLALGAKAVLLGRIWAYALAAGGGAAVSQMLALIEAEMRVAMALTGVTRVDQINQEVLHR